MTDNCYRKNLPDIVSMPEGSFYIMKLYGNISFLIGRYMPDIDEQNGIFHLTFVKNCGIVLDTVMIEQNIWSKSIAILQKRRQSRNDILSGIATKLCWFETVD